MATSSERRRAHVVMPVELVREIDALVGRRGRSRFFEEAAAAAAAPRRCVRERSRPADRGHTRVGEQRVG